MIKFFFKWILAWGLSSVALLSSYAYSQQVNYPFVSGQVVFVQSPYGSSLYTNYDYLPHDSAPHRLPAYTTNQAVFVGQYYGTTPQTVTSYPTTYANSLPYTENRYTSPAAYPSTTIPAYPYGTVGGVIASPYTTTTQSASYTYPYSAKDYTTTYTYPYTTSTGQTAYPSTTVERIPASYRTTAETMRPYSSYPTLQQLEPAYSAEAFQGNQVTTYNAYPVATDIRYPYPVTTTEVPENAIQPIAPRR
jgi:hypothetical protein